MKVKNLTKRGLRIGERSLSPGQTAVFEDGKLSEIQHLLDEGLVSVGQVRITENKPHNIYNKEDLEKLSMSELREIGDPIGAKDTKKSELIEEILEKSKEE